MSQLVVTPSPVRLHPLSFVTSGAGRSSTCNMQHVARDPNASATAGHDSLKQPEELAPPEHAKAVV